MLRERAVRTKTFLVQRVIAQVGVVRVGFSVWGFLVQRVVPLLSLPLPFPFPYPLLPSQSDLHPYRCGRQWTHEAVSQAFYNWSSLVPSIAGRCCGAREAQAE